MDRQLRFAKRYNLPSISFQRWFVIRNGLSSCVSSSLVVISVILTIHSHVVCHTLIDRSSREAVLIEIERVKVKRWALVVWMTGKISFLSPLRPLVRYVLRRKIWMDSYNFILLTSWGHWKSFYISLYTSCMRFNRPAGEQQKRRRPCGRWQMRYMWRR